MSKPSHSPLPWRSEGNLLLDSNSERIASNEENFSLMIRSVNSHYKLLEACKFALESGDDLAAIEKLKAAIKLAEGVQS